MCTSFVWFVIVSSLLSFFYGLFEYDYTKLLPLVTAGVALYGIRQWKEQKRADTTISAIKDLAMAVYSFQYAINHMRAGGLLSQIIYSNSSPASTSSSGKTPYQEFAGVLETHKGAFDTAYHMWNLLEPGLLEDDKRSFDELCNLIIIGLAKCRIFHAKVSSPPFQLTAPEAEEDFAIKTWMTFVGDSEYDSKMSVFVDSVIQKCRSRIPWK